MTHLFLIMLLSWAHSAPLDNFAKYDSPFLEVVKDVYNQGAVRDYPFWAKWMQQENWKFNPSGNSDIPPYQVCSKEDFVGLINPKEMTSSFLQAFERKLNECDPIAQSGYSDPIRNVLISFLYNVKPLEHPLARHVILHLPGQVQLKGFLALKGDLKKRPLIILRNGIFSSARDFYGERGFFLQMFDSSPFNVLMIENTSGWDFVRRDTHLGFGGFDEALQNYIIARKFLDKNEPLSKIISSLHLVGVSLGGNGVLLSSVLNELNPIGNRKVFSSFAAYCPLINFEETFKAHMNNPITAPLFNNWTAKALAGLKDRYPQLNDGSFVRGFVKMLEDEYKGPMIGAVDFRLPLRMEKELNAPFQSGRFWRLNNIEPELNNIQTPFFVMATKNDPAVIYNLNAGRLGEGKLFHNSNFVYHIFQKGYHCSLPVAYDWGFGSQILQTFILQNSPEFEQSSVDFLALESDKLPLWLKENPDWKLHKIRNKIQLDSNSVQLTLMYFNRNNLPWERHRELRLDIPLDQFQVSQKELLLSSDFGRALLQRWLAHNIRLKKGSLDLFLTWKSY